MDWMMIVQNVGTFGVGTGILALLVRSLVVNSLNKELEAHKASLLKDIEAFKSSLQLASIEHQIRFSKLHEKRAEVIQTLYEKLVALDTAIHSVLKRFQQAGAASLEDRVKEYGKLHNELNEFFLPNKIFFDTNTCQIINELLLLSRDTYFDVTTYPIDTESSEYKYGPRDLLNERHEYWENPDGHLKIPHLWPGQNPPATDRNFYSIYGESTILFSPLSFIFSLLFSLG